MGETVYILGIRIYRDRLDKLIGLCQDTYSDKALHMSNMQDSKKGFVQMTLGITLSKTQCLSTHAEQGRMRVRLLLKALDVLRCDLNFSGSCCC